MTPTTATEMPRVLSLSEAAERLNMKRSNVAKFLARRNVEPAFAKAQGYFWWETEIDRVKAEREGDKKRMAEDEKRRRATQSNSEVAVTSPPPELSRIGATQRAVLSELLRRPLRPDTNAKQLAVRRLIGRALVEPVPNEPGAFQLTADGREIAAHL